MDQMHDELLKLEGFFSNLNGGKSSLVSSAEDDEWETVGPKNKSAVTRTQSFVPSELSKIFGGQLRSVVKARGKPIIDPTLLHWRGFVLFLSGCECCMCCNPWMLDASWVSSCLLLSTVYTRKMVFMEIMLSCSVFMIIFFY